MCTKPLLIINPKYKKLARQNRVDFRHYDQHKDYHLLVPCGHCLECLGKRSKTWMVRANYLVKSRGIKIDRYSGRTYFCTLSVAPRNYKEVVKDPYKAFRKFIDRIRKHPSLIIGYNKRNRPIYKKVKLDYLAVIEFADGSRAKERGLPSTYRLHFHCIFFECPLLIKDLKKLWDKHVGIAFISRLRSAAGILYATKYMFKDNDDDQSIYGKDSLSNGKLIVSHGFGRIRQQDRIRLRGQLLVTPKSWFTTFVGNFRYPVPRYWKKCLFSDKEIKSINDELVPKMVVEMVNRKHWDKSLKFRETLINFLLWP